MKIEGLTVQHKTLGTGTVTKHVDQFIYVAFEDKERPFAYPSAFTTFLHAKDPAAQTAIIQEIENTKAAAIAKQQAAEEEKRHAAVSVKNALARSTSTPKKVVQRQARTSGKPMTFYVFQGSTFHREYQGGYLWAPITNKTGNTFHHWDCLLDVRPGDIILHGYNGYVQAVSIAKAACYNCTQPQELRTEDSWDLEGRRVDCDYIMIKNPIKTANFTEDIIRLCNTKYSPFNKSGSGNMGYLFEINRQMAKIFLQASVAANPYLKSNQAVAHLLAE